MGYPSVEIDESEYPAASWLLQQDMWYDLNLQQDLNGDGVDLLMACALNLLLGAALSATAEEAAKAPDWRGASFPTAAAASVGTGMRRHLNGPTPHDVTEGEGAE